MNFFTFFILDRPISECCECLYGRLYANYCRYLRSFLIVPFQVKNDMIKLRKCSFSYRSYSNFTHFTILIPFYFCFATIIQILVITTQLEWLHSTMLCSVVTDSDWVWRKWKKKKFFIMIFIKKILSKFAISTILFSIHFQSIPSSMGSILSVTITQWLIVINASIKILKIWTERKSSEWPNFIFVESLLKFRQKWNCRKIAQNQKSHYIFGLPPPIFILFSPRYTSQLRTCDTYRLSEIPSCIVEEITKNSENLQKVKIFKNENLHQIPTISIFLLTFLWFDWSNPNTNTHTCARMQDIWDA